MEVLCPAVSISVSFKWSTLNSACLGSIFG